MDLTNLDTIKSLCQKFRIKPSKSLGQNFLLDKSVVEKMAAAAELSEKDTVLEIGPGFGVLTEELLPRVGRLVVIEKDKRLADYLAKFKDEIEIVNEDVLKLSFSCHPELVSGSKRCRNEFGMTNENYKIVANLPYQITSPILWKFLMEENNKPEMMVIMVQKEVGERICAKTGQMSVLSVMCQLYADCEFLFEVKRDKFYPAPDVDSAVIKLVIKKQELKINEKDFIRLVKFGFSAKRKMLKNNLSGGLQKPMAEVVSALKAVKLDEKVRAQELGVEEWVKLCQKLAN